MPGELPIGFGPILILLAVAVGFSLLAVFGSKGFDLLLGSDRDGPVKGTVYESGMPVQHDSRRRFHVRYYLVAMLFLLFDVEVVLLYPWAMVFSGSINQSKAGVSTELLVQLPAAFGTEGLPGAWTAMMAVGGLFVAILIVGFVYEWRRGVFKFS